MEGFVGVDVPDPGDPPLIQQAGLDGACGAGEGLGELVGGDGQGIGAEGGEAGGAQGLGGWVGPDAAEAAGVAEVEAGAIVELPRDVEVVVGGGVLPGGRVQQLACHAEVDDEGGGAVVGREDGELFAVALDGGDGVVEEEEGAREAWVGGFGGGAGIGFGFGVGGLLLAMRVACVAAGRVQRPGDDIAPVDGDADDRAAEDGGAKGPGEAFDLGEFGHGGG